MLTVIYIRSLMQGGAEKQAILLAEELQKNREVLLVVHTHDKTAAHQDHSRVLNINFLSGNAVKKFFTLFTLLKKNKVANLICYLPVNNILGTFAGKMAGVSNILCGIRGSKSKGSVKTKLLKFICNVLRVQFISNSYRSKTVYTAMGFNAAQIDVIHNGISVPAENALISRSIAHTKPLQIISVSRFIPEKDIPTLLKAINYLVFDLNFERIKVNLVGYGPLEELIKTEIEMLNLSAYIQLTDGRTTDLASVYNNADLYILSSVYEGMPNTVMEAMSFKLPVISTDAGDAKYLVDEQNGALVNPGDFKAIALAIKAVFNDADHYKQLSEFAFKKITGEFSPTQLASAYSRFLTT